MYKSRERDRGSAFGSAAKVAGAGVAGAFAGRAIGRKVGTKVGTKAFGKTKTGQALQERANSLQNKMSAIKQKVGQGEGSNVAQKALQKQQGRLDQVSKRINRGQTLAGKSVGKSFARKGTAVGSAIGVGTVGGVEYARRKQRY